jgi:hypothetical protein
VDSLESDVQRLFGHAKGEYMKPLELLDTCSNGCLLAYERIEGA